MRPRRSMAWAFSALLATGCSSATEPSATVRYDPERARGALIAALDAWKRGEAKGLARRDPPIRFADDDLVAGWALVDYELEEPDAPILLHKNVPVILSLRDRRGKTARRETHYQVATEPGLAVLRSEP
jgi:hypothetical protein